MKKKAALVLSGGSVLGLAHLGALEVLEKEYDFDAIYGVSAGALVGAGVASGMNTEEIKNIFLETNFLTLGKDISPLNTGLIRGRKLRAYLNKILENKNIEDLPVLFRAGATDFKSGSYVQIKLGNVADALRSSISLPMIFEPYLHPDYGKYLVDGGLTRNLPVKDAIDEYTGDTIIAINVNPVDDLPDDFHKKKLFGWRKEMATYLRHSFNIMMNAQWQEPSDPRVSFINPELSSFTGFSVHKKNYDPIMEAGRIAALEFLKEE